MTGVMNYSEDDFADSDATDEVLCNIDITMSSNLHESVDYLDLNSRRRRLQPPGPPDDGENGGPPDDGDDSGDSGSTDYNSTTSGIAFTGGYIFNALAGGNVDAVINEIETLSVCLDHPTPTNQFHYHYWTPCAKAGMGLHSTTDAPALCPDTEACADWEGAADYAKTAVLDGQDSYFSASEWDYPIGLAKDGHIIMGPYKNTDGDSWQCADRDVCNGTTLVNDANENVYVYVGSDTFPYNLGCFGPGPAVNYSPTCTSNGCGDETETTDDDSNDDDSNDDDSNDDDSNDDDSEETPDFASTLAASATAAIVLSASLF